MRRNLILLVVLFCAAGMVPQAGAQSNYLIFPTGSPAVVIDDAGNVLREVPALSLTQPSQWYEHVSLSDDGTRLLLSLGGTGDGRFHIIVYDLKTGLRQDVMSVVDGLLNLRWLPGSNTRFLIADIFQYGDSHIRIYDLCTQTFEPDLWQSNDTLVEAGIYGYQFRRGISWDQSYSRFVLGTGRPYGGGDFPVWGRRCDSTSGQTVCNLKALPTGLCFQSTMTTDGQHIYTAESGNSGGYDIIRRDYQSGVDDFTTGPDSLVASRPVLFGWAYYGPYRMGLADRDRKVGFLESAIAPSFDSFVLCDVESKACRTLYYAAAGLSNWVQIPAEDTTPPEIASVTPTSAVLWPPNHKLVPVTLAVAVTDGLDPAPACQVTSVSSNEPQNGLGDGDTPTDWLLGAGLSVKLRAERGGAGNGRVYSIRIACVDASGNEAVATAVVTVPKNGK